MTQPDEGRVTPHAFKNAVEFTCVEEPENISEPSTHDLSTVQPGYLHLPSIALPSMPKQTESLPISPLTTYQALLHDDRIRISIQEDLQHPTTNNLPPSARSNSQFSEHGPAPTEAVWKRLSGPPPIYTTEQVSPLRGWEGAEGMPCFHAMPYPHATR